MPRALNACAQSAGQKTTSTARALDSRFWAGSGLGAGAPCAVCLFVGAAVRAVALLVCQAKDIGGVNVKHRAKIGERV